MGLGQVSVGELRMPLQLFTSLVRSSTPGDIVGGGFFKLQSPDFVLSAADNALRSGSSSPAPRTRDSNSIVSSRPSLGAPIRGGKPRSTLVDLAATDLGLGARLQALILLSFLRRRRFSRHPVGFPALMIVPTTTSPFRREVSRTSPRPT